MGCRSAAATWSTHMIREAGIKDLEQVLVLYQHLHPNEQMLPIEQIRPTWRTLLANLAICCLVAEHHGQLVATCTLVIVPNLTHSARPYALIENVVTHPAHCRQGYGKAILQAALQRAWQ